MCHQQTRCQMPSAGMLGTSRSDAEQELRFPETDLPVRVSHIATSCALVGLVATLLAPPPAPLPASVRSCSTGGGPQVAGMQCGWMYTTAGKVSVPNQLPAGHNAVQPETLQSHWIELLRWLIF